MIIPIPDSKTGVGRLAGVEESQLRRRYADGSQIAPKGFQEGWIWICWPARMGSTIARCNYDHGKATGNDHGHCGWVREDEVS